MKNNPIARVMYDIFNRDVANTGYVLPNNTHNADRVIEYVKEVNNFFINSGLPAVNIENLQIDEKRLLHFSLQISGYIRDAQEALRKMEDKHATDEDLIQLYRASAHYSVKCSGTVKGNKYVFKDDAEYCVWKISDPADLANADYEKVEEISSDKKCVIVSMPFHIKTTQEELRKWMYNCLHDVFQNKKTFGKDVNVYAVHFPIEQPRGNKFSLILGTIREPQTFSTQVDKNFVNKYMTSFLGENLKFNENDEIISGRPYTSEEMKEKMHNLILIGWCGGVHNACRIINVMDDYAQKVHSKEDVDEALKNAFILSYGVLPISKQNKCSGAYFFSNYDRDENRKEPFTKMFQPNFYEKVKNREQDSKARITTLPDKNNFIVSLKLAKDLIIVDNKSKITRLGEQNNGHNFAFVTATNLSSEDNYANFQYRTVLENAVDGKRGIHIFDIRDFSNPSQVLNSYNSIWHKKKIQR